MQSCKYSPNTGAVDEQLQTVLYTFAQPQDYHRSNHSRSLILFPGTFATDFKVSQNCKDFETLNENGCKPNY